MIAGKNILLRSIEIADVDLLTKWNFDETFNQFFPPRLPNSQAEQEDWIRQQTGPSKKKLIAVDIKTQTPFAFIGLMNWDQLNRNCEMGITVGDHSYLGNKLVKEAFGTILIYGFQNMNLHLIHLRVFENNARAIAFFEKFGFKKEGVLRNRIFKNGSYVSWISMSLTEKELINL